VPSSLGAPEILVILVVALIVLGPSKLPEASRQIGKALAEVRRWSQNVQSEIRDVIDVDPDPPAPPTYTEPTPPPQPPPTAQTPPPDTPPPGTAAPTTPSSSNGSIHPTPTAAPKVTAEPTDASSGGQPPA